MRTASRTTLYLKSRKRIVAAGLRCLCLSQQPILLPGAVILLTASIYVKTRHIRVFMDIYQERGHITRLRP